MCEQYGRRCPSDEYGGHNNSPSVWRRRKAKSRAKQKLITAQATGDAETIAAAQKHYDSFTR